MGGGDGREEVGVGGGGGKEEVGVGGGGGREEWEVEVGGGGGRWRWERREEVNCNNCFWLVRIFSNRGMKCDYCTSPVPSPLAPQIPRHRYLCSRCQTGILQLCLLQ